MERLKSKTTLLVAVVLAAVLAMAGVGYALALPTSTYTVNIYKVTGEGTASLATNMDGMPMSFQRSANTGTTVDAVEEAWYCSSDVAGYHYVPGTIEVNGKSYTSSGAQEINEDGSTVFNYYLSPDSYTLSFIANNGMHDGAYFTNGEETIEVTSGSKITLPSDGDVKRPGYTLFGWYTNEWNDYVTKDCLDQNDIQNILASGDPNFYMAGSDYVVPDMDAGDTAYLYPLYIEGETSSEPGYDFTIGISYQLDESWEQIDWEEQQVKGNYGDTVTISAKDIPGYTYVWAEWMVNDGAGTMIPTTEKEVTFPLSEVNDISFYYVKDEPETDQTSADFNFHFKATGIQATGFNDYHEAFAALNN